MRFAIIAAGQGARLAHEGVATAKPLVSIGGERLIERLVRIFMHCGASSISIIINDQHPATRQCVEQLRQQGLPISYMVKSTPSSMHSLYELSPLLEGDEPFVLTTVDTVFHEAEFRHYVEQWQQLQATTDGLMGITSYIDDEKPLYVSIDDKQQITAFNDYDPQPRYVSGGIYGLTPASLSILRACIKRGESRMRNFQRALLASRLRLQAWQFSKVLDIDHASDILKAEEFLCR